MPRNPGNFFNISVSMRQTLLILIFVLLVPALLLQTIIYYRWYQTRKFTELQTNLELARATSASLRENIRNIVREEMAIGKAITTFQPFSTKRANEFLAMTQIEYPYLRSLLWSTPKGVFTAGSDQRAIGVNIADRPYFQEIVKGREWVVSDLLPKGRVSGKMAFIVARGIRDASGTLQGVVVASVDPQRLGELLFAAEHPQEGYTTVFDSQGTLIYSRPESELVGQSWQKNDKRLSLSLNGKEIAEILPSPFDGQDHFTALVPVQNLHWVIGSSRPTSEALQPVIKSLQIVFTLLVLAAMSSILAAIIVSQYIIRHLRLLQSHARAIGQGDFTSRVTSTSIAEMAELTEAFNTAAEMLRERTEEAEKALAELERSNKELERFAYISSHDLQEPLRMVAGFLQLLKRRYHGKLDPEADEFIDYAVDGAARMKTLINDLLVFSRLGTKAKPFELVNIGTTFEQVLNNLSASIAKSNATITHDPLPVIQADPTQLAQVFQNLIANAIKFCGSEPPRIHVGAVHKANEWLFSVSDNGIGIDPQYYSRIFIIFQRLHDQSEYTGTGLGLAICKKVVERHNGHIWVESQPGHGSTFFFTIPDRTGES